MSRVVDEYVDRTDPSLGPIEQPFELALREVGGDERNVGA